MNEFIADYEAERGAIAALFEDACQHRILLVCGQSGSGKTHLLMHCRQSMPAGVIHIPIQLRGTAVTIAEIFYRAGGGVGWARMGGFTQTVAGLHTLPPVKIDRNWLAGIQNHINVALHAENLSDREDRLAALTEAWFADVREVGQTVLILFDTFEQANETVREWISGPFLARVAAAPSVRVVVAGQMVPPGHNIEWGHCCQERALYGVRDAAHWMPVVQAMDRYIPVDAPQDWLAGVCHALEGRPEAIRKVIEGLPRRSGLA